jgi:hypothetical protein
MQPRGVKEMSELNMPIAPSATVRHKVAFRRCKDFSNNDTVVLISSHNPWRPKSTAWDLFEFVLRVKPISTVGEILADARAIGYYDSGTMQHLRWLYTWGDFIEINGQRHFPKEPLPGMED